MRRLFAAPFIVLVLVGGGTSYAADVDDVKARLTDIMRRSRRLTLPRSTRFGRTTAPLSIRSRRIRPSLWVGKERGRNFESLIAAVAETSIAQAEGPHIQVRGDLAWSAGMVKSDAKLKAGQHLNGVILEADVFKKQDGRWLLVSHITSVMPQ